MTRATRRRAFALIAALFSVALFSCTLRARRPDGPYREAQELVDALSDLAVECTRHNTRPDSGQVVITATLTPPHEIPSIQGEGSSPGTEAILACVRERAQPKLRNPAAVPAPLARIRVPLPLVPAAVTYAFAQETPDAGTQ